MIDCFGHLQLSESLPQKENLCLLSDETSKYGKKMEGFHVRDEDGRLFVFELRQLATKSGQDTLSTFQDILSDISNVSANAENTVCKQILFNIVSTMSDKAATQQKFNTLLEGGGRVVRWCWVNFQCRGVLKLDYSRARAYCTCSRCGRGLLHFYSHLSFLSFFSLSLGDGPI